MEGIFQAHSPRLSLPHANSPLVPAPTRGLPPFVDDGVVEHERPTRRPRAGVRRLEASQSGTEYQIEAGQRLYLYLGPEPFFPEVGSPSEPKSAAGRVPLRFRHFLALRITAFGLPRRRSGWRSLCLCPRLVSVFDVRKVPKAKRDPSFRIFAGGTPRSNHGGIRSVPPPLPRLAGLRSGERSTLQVRSRWPVLDCASSGCRSIKLQPLYVFCLKTMRTETDTPAVEVESRGYSETTAAVPTYWRVEGCRVGDGSRSLAPWAPKSLWLWRGCWHSEENAANL